ncbi:MAG: hypothetical protein WKF84_07715 [Pyrinomonadaceae bacterium]
MVFVALVPGSPLDRQITALWTNKNLNLLPMRNALDVVAARRLSRFIKEREIEIVHAHMARARHRLAALAVLSREAARLTSHARQRTASFGSDSIAQLSARAARVQSRLPSACSARQATGSKASVPPALIAGNGNGVDFSEFNEEAGRKLFIDSHFLRHTLACSGELSSVKGQEHLLARCGGTRRTLSQRSIPDRRVQHCYAPTKITDAVRALIDTLGLNARVRGCSVA